MIDRYNARNPVVGNLYVTTTHLIFAFPESNKETWVSGETANNQQITVGEMVFDFRERGIKS